MQAFTAVRIYSYQYALTANVYSNSSSSGSSSGNGSSSAAAALTVAVAVAAAAAVAAAVTAAVAVAAAAAAVLPPAYDTGKLAPRGGYEFHRQCLLGEACHHTTATSALTLAFLRAQAVSCQGGKGISAPRGPTPAVLQQW